MATSLVEVSADLVRARIEDLTRQLELAESDLEELTPQEPESLHAVIRFWKWDQSYIYVAVKTHLNADGKGVWYISQDGSRTSRQGIPPKTWAQLVAWIGERNWARIEVLS